MSPELVLEHCPYSLAVVVPFLLVAAGYALREWARDRGARRWTSGRVTPRNVTPLRRHVPR